MPTRLSGFKPTGPLQLGNYLGAIRPVVDAQHRVDSVVLVADLHALTVDHEPDRVRTLTTQAAALLLAAGVDPDTSLLYVQSQVPEHAELHYLLECVTGYGEAHRMIQFKERTATRSQVRLSLLTYPVLMAADVLLHGADEVPVGDDQSQHVELARDVAVRFNNRYGETFVVPKAVAPPVAARLMNLADPSVKMGKTGGPQAGVLRLLDPPDVLRRTVLRAVTDSARGVRYDPVAAPGAAALLEIMAACVREEPGAVAQRFDSYRDLKTAVADMVVATLAPVRQRYADLAADPGYLRSVLDRGAQRARERVAATLRRAKTALGLG
jgi:tryptophanyl-tRNA synthetase